MIKLPVRFLHSLNSLPVIPQSRLATGIAFDLALELALGLALGLVSCGLVGCSSSDSPKPEAEPVEIKDRSKPAVETPESMLLREAQRYYQAGLYSVASDSFEKLRDGYPLGAYAELADIKIADSQFESSNYTGAAASYEEFLKNRPSSPITPYALLRAARSNQLAYRGVGRDAAALKKALDLYQQLLIKYPHSPYSEGAQALQQQTKDLLAANDKEVLEFYKKKDKQAAYEARKVAFASQYGKDGDSFSLPDEPPPLAENLPNAPQGTRVLFETSLGESASATRPIPASARDAKTSLSNSARLKPEVGSGPLIRLVECERSQRLIFLHLSAPLSNPGTLEKLNPLGRLESGFTFQIPELRTPGNSLFERDCFGSRDVSVSPGGLVHIAAPDSAAQLLELSSPPRILVSLRR